MSWFGPASILAECPRWDDASQRLQWVDIDGGTLHEAHLIAGAWSTSEHSVAAPLAGAVLLDNGTRATWLVAVGGSLTTWTVSGGMDMPRVVEPASDRCPMRLNEMVTDPIGRVWVGSMAYNWTERAGSFFRVDLDGSIHRVLDQITIANGVGWSPDSTTMYTTDTDAARITAWDYNLDTGAVSRPRPFHQARADTGRPDGLAVDTDGNVWSAFAGGYHVRCFDASGRETERVRIPAPNPTSCCFAGRDRDRLLITTGRKRLTAEMLDEHPDSGRIWDTGPIGARGLPQVRARVKLNQSEEPSGHGH